MSLRKCTCHQTGFGWYVNREVLEEGLEMGAGGGSWNRETFLSHCCCLAQPVERAEHRDPGKPARGNKLLWL